MSHPGGDSLTIVLAGGPFDGATLQVPVDLELPSELILREVWCRPYGDALYALDKGCGMLELTLGSLEHPSTTYRYTGTSEVMSVVHQQARELVRREEEIKRLRKRLERIGRKATRMKAAQKAAKTRKAKKTGVKTDGRSILPQ